MKTKLSPRQVFERSITENDILGAIRSILEMNGARVFRAVERVPKCYRCGCYLGSSERGLPDLYGYFYKFVIINPGFPTHFFIEVKRKGGKLRPAQAAWIAQAQADGIIAFKADSVEEMVAEFKQRGIVVKGL